MSELEDIILTIDTREQNQKRIKAVEDWFTGHGTVVEHSALKHCDYRLIGEFRGVSVNLGVEAKGWDNFLSDDIAEMEEKLLLATEEYEHVGFFVETQNYTFTPDENNSHGKLNYSIPKLNKSLPAKTLASMEGMFDTISKHPQIHVRQLRSEAQFPYSFYDLLVYIQKPHTLTVKPEGYVPSLQNLYMQIPQVGMERAKTLIQHYPNLFWLCSASEPSLVEVMGQSMGTILYQFLHNSELLTPEWRVGHHGDGTVKYKTICGQDCYNPQHCNTLCERHPNNPKNLKKQDDEGRLAFDAPAKNPVMCGHIDTKCGFADPKNRAECKTPNHFKTSRAELKKAECANASPAHSSHVEAANFESTTNSPSASADTSQSLSTKPKGIEQGGRIERKTSLSRTTPKLLGTHDTTSHPGSFLKSITPSVKPDDLQGIPPIETKSLSPAETDIGLDGNTYEYREVKPNVTDLKPKMNLKETIKDFMQDGKPHEMQEIVDRCEGWTPGNVWQHVVGAVKSGYFKKTTEQNKITFQRIT